MTDDKGRAMLVLEALRKRPGVFRELVLALGDTQDIRVAGPWVENDEALVRLDTAGDPAAYIRAFEDGPEVNYNWETRESDADGTSMTCTLGESRELADKELEDGGWVFSTAAPDPEEIWSLQTTKEFVAGVWESGTWKDGSRSWTRPLRGMLSKLAASVVQQPDDSYTWSIYLPWDSRPWEGSEPVLGDAQKAADEALQGNGFSLTGPLVTDWLPDTQSLTESWCRRDGNGVPVARVTQRTTASGTLFHVTLSKHILGPPGGFANLSGAKAAADTKLRGLGYELP